MIVAWISSFICVRPILGAGNSYVPHEVIVIFANSTTLVQARELLDGEDFHVVNSVYSHLSIYLVEILNPTLTEHAAVDSLWKLSFIAKAHLNRIYNPAFQPNDALFPDQWYLSQPFWQGYNADVNAPEAWEITTGENSFFGEEVVVAVIDEGFDRIHPELYNRQWRNTVELNGITGADDDQNGAIDDTLGYRVYSEYETIDGGRSCYSYPEEGEQIGFHGTGVAGFVTAQSNNESLIAAPNWGCKSLLVATCVLTDAHIDSALSYIRQTKERWYETNGVCGANIIAINMSFSTGRGENETSCDTTNWNDILNDLGALGVLLRFCRSNEPTDVDIPGIVPAGCASDFLTSVSASNKWDAKPSWASYGDSTIDLFAPGADLIALQHVGDTLVTIGNSAACPQVASTIALAYSIPNPSFQEYYSLQRDSAALDLKQIVLDNVERTDWNSVPFQESVTGGRLNMQFAVQGMCNFYRDNGHSFVSQVNSGSTSSSSPNYVRGRGNHTVYSDGSDLYYAWHNDCFNEPRIYKLTSPNTPGVQPCIASSEYGDTTDVFMAWLGGEQGLSVLEHKVIGTCTESSSFQEEWRLAKLAVPAPSGQGVTSHRSHRAERGGHHSGRYRGRRGRERARSPHLARAGCRLARFRVVGT